MSDFVEAFQRMTLERDTLRAENERLREALRAVTKVHGLMCIGDAVAIAQAALDEGYGDE